MLRAFRTNVRPQLIEAGRIDELTDREHDVLRHMARGATNTEIAKDLYVSEATVKSHVGAIFAKLGVRARAARSSSPTTTGLSLPRPGTEPT